MLVLATARTLVNQGRWFDVFYANTTVATASILLKLKNHAGKQQTHRFFLGGKRIISFYVIAYSSISDASGVDIIDTECLLPHTAI